MPYYIIHTKTREVIAIEDNKPPDNAYPNYLVEFHTKVFSPQTEDTPADIIPEGKEDPEPVSLDRLVAILVSKNVVTTEDLK